MSLLSLYEKTHFLQMRKQRHRSTAQLISAFVFDSWIVQSLFYLNPKFQASSHLLWLYSLVCDGPGRKPRRPVFSQRGSAICSHIGNVMTMTCTQGEIIVYPCSCVRRCPHSQCSNILSSKTAWPIKAKFRVESKESLYKWSWWLPRPSMVKTTQVYLIISPLAITQIST